MVQLKEQDGVSDEKMMNAFSNEPLHPLYVYKWFSKIDCFDHKTWYEAQILEMDDNLVKVHYKNFSKNFDEYIPIHSNRIALLNSHTHKPISHHPISHVYRGLHIDCMDPGDKPFQATIVSIHQIHPLVLVNYSGFNDSLNEWLPNDSMRMAPLHTWTRYGRPFMGRSPVGVPQYLLVNGSNKVMAPPSEDREIEFRNQLSEKGWKIEEMAGDGNCLFRSISYIIYGNSDYHNIVREKCMEYILIEKEYFKNYIDTSRESFDQYIERMRNLGEWGDNVEIQAMSEIYNRPIQIYAYSNVPMKTYTAESVNEPIRLSYHHRSHYCAIVYINDPYAGIIKIPPGEIENKRIKYSRSAICISIQSRKGSDNNIISNAGTTSSTTSEYDSTELEAYRHALELSRSAFRYESASIESACAASLSQIEIDAAKIESLRQYEIEQEKKLKEIETKTEITNDLILENALMESINSVTSSLPKPIQLCMQFGYSQSSCEEAYTMICSQMDISNLDENTIMAAMLLLYTLFIIHK